MDSIEYFLEVIINKGYDLDKYRELYTCQKWDEMFHQALYDNFLELVEYLYVQYKCKFYLKEYTLNMDQDLLQLLNDDRTLNERGYRLMIKNKNNECFQYLLDMRKKSKLLKDEKGFYYIFSKNSI